MHYQTRRDVNKKIIGVIGIGQDITEQKRAHMAQVRAEKAQASAQTAIIISKQMYAYLAHEINNPSIAITGRSMEISGLLDAMKDRLESRGETACLKTLEQCQTHLEKLNHSIASIQQIVEHTLEFAKLENQQFTFK